jgi:Haem-binding domain
MKARMKKAALVAVTIFVLIQFVQPARNESGQVLDTDISKIVALPERVQGILARSCFDCHSNNTHYPWHTYIQPGGWFMAYHVRNGKEKLNFSEFGAYSKRRQGSKLESIGKQIEAGEMPLPSYLLLHENAELSPSEKELLINWANDSRDSLTNIH